MRGRLRGAVGGVHRGPLSGRCLSSGWGCRSQVPVTLCTCSSPYPGHTWRPFPPAQTPPRGPTRSRCGHVTPPRWQKGFQVLTTRPGTQQGKAPAGSQPGRRGGASRPQRGQVLRAPLGAAHFTGWKEGPGGDRLRGGPASGFTKPFIQVLPGGSSRKLHWAFPRPPPPPACIQPAASSLGALQPHASPKTCTAATGHSSWPALLLSQVICKVTGS